MARGAEAQGGGLCRGAVGALLGAGMAAGLTGCMPSGPPAAQVPGARATGRQEPAFVEAMRPRRPGRPVVAVLARNEGTETTDFLVTHAVLVRSGVAEVHAVAPRAGPVALTPALEVQLDEDLAGFDRAHPAGADYVVVPAIQPEDDPAVTGWLRHQAGLGARIVGICRGARVLGRAGLLDGRAFTGHWTDADRLSRRHPGATHVRDLRYVADRGVATSTGITASVPAMLALVEAIGGRERAAELAAELGVASWGPEHDSSPFHLDARRRLSYLANLVASLRKEARSVEVRDGADDVALALVADAWARTGRVRVEAASPSGAVRLRSGLPLVTSLAAERTPPLPASPALPPVPQLDRALCRIAERYGEARREWVMLELEYPGPARWDCGGQAPG
jgi:transcriptional regulator GlxA family with amidase domain